MDFYLKNENNAYACSSDSRLHDPIRSIDSLCTY